MPWWLEKHKRPGLRNWFRLLRFSLKKCWMKVESSSNQPTSQLPTFYFLILKWWDAGCALPTCWTKLRKMWMTTCFPSTAPIALGCYQRLSNFPVIDSDSSSVDGTLKYSKTKYFTMALQTLFVM